jgi:hypothetical protein
MDSLTHVPTPGATKIYGLDSHTAITSKYRLTGVSNCCAMLAVFGRPHTALVILGAHIPDIVTDLGN